VYALKRIIAYVIDMLLVVGPLSGLMTAGELSLIDSIPGPLHGFTAMGLGFLALGAPVLVLGVLSGLTGRTPGKFIMFLKVQDAGGDAPGIAQGILREIVKAVSVGFFFGSIWALQGIVTGGQTFYDTWLDLEVEDLRPSGLTPTQKKFRKYMREQARRQKRGL
jgi:uncharacterized RDD family membrane protein YckC